MGEHVASDKTSLSDALLTQIHAMAETHALSLLTGPRQANVQSRIAFGDIVRSALAPWLFLTNDENRLSIDLHIEPDDTITLCAHRAYSVAMLVFELTSDEAKYGALGDIGGQLTAQVVKAANDKATFSWAENRSPNAALRRVETASDGFGKTLIKHCIGSLGGVCEQSVTDGGFSFELTMPMGDT